MRGRFGGFVFFVVGLLFVAEDGFCHALRDGIFGNPHHRGAFVDALSAFHQVAHKGNGVHHLAGGLRYFQGVVTGVFQQYSGFETHKVDGVVLDKILYGLGAVFLGVAVGVVVVGEKHHTHPHAFAQQQVDGAYRRLDTWRVAVVHQGDVAGVAFYHAYLLFGERGAARGNGVFQSRLVHRNNVDITFHKVAEVLS